MERGKGLSALGLRGGQFLRVAGGSPRWHQETRVGGQDVLTLERGDSAEAAVGEAR